MSLIGIMSPALECVDKSMSVASASELMLKHGFGALVVGTPEKMLGIVTERDVLYKVVAKNLSPKDVKLHEIMSSPVDDVSMSVDPNDALRKMDRMGYRHLPVVDERGLAVGMLSIRDLFHHIVKSQEAENQALLEFLSADGFGG